MSLSSHTSLALDLWLATLADCELETICCVTQTPHMTHEQVWKCAEKYPILWSSEAYAETDDIVEIAELAPQLENGAWWVETTGPGYDTTYILGGPPGPPQEIDNSSDECRAQWMSYPELLTALMKVAEENPQSIDF